MSTLLASRDGGLREPRPRVYPRPFGPDARPYSEPRHLGPFNQPSDAFVVPWQLPEVSESER